MAVKVCPKLKEETAHFIGSIVWKQGGDIRDVINVSKLVKKSDGPAEIEQIMEVWN